MNGFEVVQKHKPTLGEWFCVSTKANKLQSGLQKSQNKTFPPITHYELRITHYHKPTQVERFRTSTKEQNRQGEWLRTSTEA